MTANARCVAWIWWEEEGGGILALTHLTHQNSYGYVPAFERFKDQIKILHFIGSHKPWHGMPHPGPGELEQPEPSFSSSFQPLLPQSPHPSSSRPSLFRPLVGMDSVVSLVEQWWRVHDEYVSYCSSSCSYKTSFVRCLRCLQTYIRSKSGSGC